jgi:DNA sulfur modification protein DndB
MRSRNFYNISAIKRENKGVTIYSASVPFAFAAQCFISFDSSLPPEERAQRSLDKRHAKKIRGYIEQNQHYYLPPLIVSISGEAEFKPFRQDSDAGILKISMKGLYTLLDGQHRTHAIKDLLQDESVSAQFKDERITVDFILNVPLKQAQTYFRLLNDTAKPVSKNLTVLYSDNPTVQDIHEILSQIPLFNVNLVEKEKTNITAKSEKLFVYKWIFSATQRFRSGISDEFDRHYTTNFWNTLTEVIPQWQMVQQGELAATEIRKNYICTHGMFIESLGELGKVLVSSCEGNPHKVGDHLRSLQNIDWSKTNKDWRNNVLDKNGKMLSRAGNRKFLVDYMLQTINSPTFQSQAA